MKEIVSRDIDKTVTLVRDEHDESGQYHVHTLIHDDHIIDRNKRIKQDALMAQGSKTPFMDGGVMIRTFSIPPAHWTLFKRKNKDLVKRLFSSNDTEREKAARELSILHPEWVTNLGK